MLKTLTRIMTDKSAIGDLWQTLSQTTKTSKYYRRERALAYILEAYTGGSGSLTINKPFALEILNITDALKRKTDQSEVSVACERIEKRMQLILNGPDVCVACGDLLTSDHKCTNKRAIAKDAAMAKE